MKKSLKTDRWDPIKETDPADFTNDKLVARWKAECDKWKAVRNQGTLTDFMCRKKAIRKFWER